MGDGEEINLVAHLARSNIGPFRRLERRALKHPGSLYFTFWIYGARQSQIPVRVEQGLFIPGFGGEVMDHYNYTKKE